MTPEVHIIVAIDRANAIGRAGDQLFYIKEDLRHFKELTMGHPIIMGRKTFEALPKGALPGRRNIVVTRNAAYQAPGAEIAPSVEGAIDLCADTDRVYIIGGAQIYAQALPPANVLHITEIDATVSDADTFFPPFADFVPAETTPWLPTEPPIRFLTYRRPTH